MVEKMESLLGKRDQKKLDKKIKDFLSVRLTRRITGALVSGRNEFEPTIVGEFRRSRNTRKDILSYA